MSSTATSQVKTRPGRGSGSRGAGQRGGRGGARGKSGSGPKRPPTEKAEETTQATVTPTAKEAIETPEVDDNIAICWICAEPVKYYSVSQCNHRTCHVCSLRLRALYKKMDCTFCKEPQPIVIFTTSEDALFSSFTLESMPNKDTKLAIYFETQDMMEEILLLLRFNCPDSECDYIGKGWADLKLHVRATHGKLMCELCIRSKKVFAHEHALYTYTQLSIHLPSMNARQRRDAAPKEQIEGGIHPLCEFCRECFFSDDELYAHMREKHEECFVCKRNEVRDQYFLNYEGLERHFHTAHHPCTYPSCLAQKFVVFGTPLDLKAHMVETHGTDMTARDRKEAMRIQADFEFEEVGAGGRRAGGRRDRDREPPQPPPRQQQQPRPPAAPGPSRPPGGGRRREGFGASLTVAGGSGSATPNGGTPAGPSRRASPSPPRADVDPAVLERHAAFIERLHSLTNNPATAVPAVKSAIRGYRASESSARDLISTIWTVLDNHLEQTASIINAFVDLLDEEDKKQDLLSSWRGFEIEQRRQFPDLVASATGSGYAGITSGRVLNAKQSTASRSSQQSSGQVLDRVARAANASTSSHSIPGWTPPERFPALGPNSSAAAGPSVRQGQRKTPWSASSAAGGGARTAPTASTSAANSFRPAVVGPSSAPRAPRAPPPSLSKSLFPELPTSTARQSVQVSGNTSLRKILGNSTAPAVPAWQPGGGASANGSAVATSGAGADGEGEEVAPTTGKGKKGKGKQKQTLFTLGSFPT